jgi:hypothetical protein
MKTILGRTLAFAAAIAVVAACSNDGINAPGSVNPTLEPIPNDAFGFEAVAGKVKVCTFDEDGTFTTVASSGAPATILSPTTIDAGTCHVTWLRNAYVGSVNFTVTLTAPAGASVDRLFLKHTDAAQSVDLLDPAGCEGTMDIPLSTTFTLANASEGATIWFKQCPVMPEPPGDCVGLTPGFWKNWANHFTAAQFALLLDGTSSASLTNAQATAVLGANNPPLARMRKFLLANELTMSLTNSVGLPNPSGGSLTGDCAIGNSDLADVIALAKLMSANPGNYNNGQFNAVGSLLDQFANMDD